MLLFQETFRLFIKPLFEELRRDVEFNRVVTGRDRLDVPLDVAELLILADVVEVVDDEEGKEHGTACNDQAFNLTFTYVLLWQDTTNLHVY